MTSFWPKCVLTSAIARFIPIFKLEYFWNAKTYTGEILIWCHIDGVLSEKPQNTHNLNCLFFNGCLGWKFKNCWNDCNMPIRMGTSETHVHVVIASFLFIFISLVLTGILLYRLNLMIKLICLPWTACSMSNVLLYISYGTGYHVQIPASSTPLRFVIVIFCSHILITCFIYMKLMQECTFIRIAQK